MLALTNFIFYNFTDSLYKTLFVEVDLEEIPYDYSKCPSIIVNLKMYLPILNKIIIYCEMPFPVFLIC